MKTIKLNFPCDIIATGPWVAEPGYLDRRVVLRDMGHQYVVHTQGADDDGEVSYNEGNYFPKLDTPNSALSRAFAAFTHRIGRLLDTDAADIADRIDNGTITRQMIKRGLITFSEV